MFALEGLLQYECCRSIHRAQALKGHLKPLPVQLKEEPKRAEIDGEQ